jgi:hypothetical protein
MEQKTVARALRCTVTKVSYFENAQRPVVPRDLDEVLLPLYGVPRERWHEYLDAAEKARRKAWWDEYDDEVIPEWFRRYVGFEQGATSLRIYEPQFIPGLVQTPGYAYAILRRGPVELGADDLDKVVELRMRRQELVMRDKDPVDLWLVLDEAALRRPAGGPEIMRPQIARLVEAAERPNIRLLILPFSAGIHPGMGSGFTILEFTWETDPGLVYTESGWSAGVYLEEPHEVEDHMVIFERLAALCLDRDESLGMLRELAKE